MRPISDNIVPTQAAATVTTAPFYTSQVFYGSAQIICTGSAAGTLKLQASNEIPVNGALPSNYSDIPSATVAVSGAGSYLIPKTEFCYRQVRIVYTNTGTGTISINFQGMGA